MHIIILFKGDNNNKNKIHSTFANINSDEYILVDWDEKTLDIKKGDWETKSQELVKEYVNLK